MTASSTAARRSPSWCASRDVSRIRNASCSTCSPARIRGIAMSESFDIVIIGGGPGGYVAAIRAAPLCMRTACVESRDRLGGTCLNIGCIPSKALLQSSEKFAEATHAFAAHGVKLSGVELDLATMMARKDKVVADLTKGIDFLFKKNKVTWIKGTGRIIAPGKVAVRPVDGGAAQEIIAKSIVIATGSDSLPLPGVEID